MENILNNNYIVAKKLNNLSMPGVSLRVDDATNDRKTDLSGSYIAREIYTIAFGKCGEEWIFIDGKRTMLDPIYKAQQNSAPRFTPIGCTFDQAARYNDFIITGGFADGVTVWNALGCPDDIAVLAIVGEAGAPLLARQIKREIPGCNIVIALDNDIKSKTGQRVAAGSGCHWVVPTDAGCDWNDVYINRGLKEVRDQLSKLNCATLDYNVYDLEFYDFGSVFGKKNQLTAFKNITDPLDVATAAKTLAWTLRNEIGIRYEDYRGLVNFIVDSNFIITQKTIDSLMLSAKSLTKGIKQRALKHITISDDQLYKHYHTKFESSSDAVDYAMACDGVTLIKAPHGDGKTFLIAKPYVELQKGKGDCVVTIAPLRTLVADLATKFNCEHYLEIQNLYETDPLRRSLTLEQWCEASYIKVLAICLPSIVKSLEDVVKKVDTLIVDEVTQVVRFITSEMGGMDNVAVLNRFVDLIKSAKNIMCLDADLNEATVTFFEKILPAEEFNIITVPNPTRRKSGLTANLIYGESHAEWIVSMAADDLKNGNRICIATDSQSKAENVATLLGKLCPDSRILSVHSANSGDEEQQKFIANADVEAEKYDCIIHSPSISSGVSISKVHFDTGYALFCGTTILPMTAIQMLRRCRTIRDWYIGINERVDNSLIDESVIIKQHQQLDRMITRKGVKIDNCEPFNRLYNSIKSMAHECNGNFAIYLVHHLQYFGFNITRQEAVEVEEKQQLTLSDVSKERRREYKDMVINAPDLHDDQYEELSNKENKTEKERAAIVAYLIRENFGVKHIEDEHITLFENGALSKISMLRWAIKSDKMIERHAMTAALRKYQGIKGGFIRNMIALSGSSSSDLENFGFKHTEVNAMAEYVWDNRQTLIVLGLMSRKYYSYPVYDKDGVIKLFKEKARPKKDGTIVRDVTDKMGLLVKPKQAKDYVNNKRVSVTNYDPSGSMKYLLHGVEKRQFELTKIKAPESTADEFETEFGF